MRTTCLLFGLLIFTLFSSVFSIGEKFRNTIKKDSDIDVLQDNILASPPVLNLLMELRAKQPKQSGRSVVAAPSTEDSSDSTQSTQPTSSPAASETDSKTITLSTYVFGLLTAGVFVVGCIASYVCTRLTDSGRK